MSLSNREDFQVWRDHPLTREFLALLEANHLSLTQAWGRGRLMPPEAQTRAEVLGALSRLRHRRDQCEDNETSIEELMGADWTPEPEEKHDG